MPRPTVVVLCLGLAFAAGLPGPASDAQSSRDARAQPEAYVTAPRAGAMKAAGSAQEGREGVPRQARQLDADELVRHLAAMGYSDIGNVRRRGPTYIVDARDPWGARVRLVIGPSGRIIGTQYLGRR